jgi:HlyD family secretion protein
VSKLGVIIPVAIVILGGGYFAYRAWQERNGGDQIKLSGNIELTEVDVAFKMPGKLMELKVDEGSAVRVGEVLARLDTMEAERALNREQAGAQAMASALVQLRTAIEYQRATTESDIAVRRADLRQAEARLQELENGSRPEEKGQAQAAEAEARTQYVQASADWTRAQRLIKDDDISRQQYDQFQARYDATAAALRRAQEARRLVDLGPRQEQVEQARAAAERARAALRLSEASRIDLRRREEEVTMRQADLKRQQAQVGVLQTQLNDRTLVSPVTGVVLTKSAEAGEVLAAGAAALTLGDIDRPWMRGYVGERDLGKVKLGMPVEVTSDSYPGKIYKGHITFISSEAEFTPKQIQTQEERVKLVYRMKIEVENPNRELKLNMPVDAVIRLK